MSETAGDTANEMHDGTSGGANGSAGARGASGACAGAGRAPRVAVVTGGGAGIGREAARALADDGWLVLVSGRTAATLEGTCDRPGIRTHVADVTDEEQVEGLFDVASAWAAQEGGRLGLAVVNAGSSGATGEFGDIAADDFRAAVEVNLVGAFLTARAAFRRMRDQEPSGGRILVNGSIAAQVPRPNSAPYAASKAGLNGLTDVISLDGRAHGITCGQVDFGNAATALLGGFGATTGALQADGSRRVEPSFPATEAGRAIAYMASLPDGAVVDRMTVTAAGMPFVGRG